MTDQFDVLFEGHQQIDVAEKMFLHLVIHIYLQHTAGLLDLDRILGKVANVIDFQPLF